MEIQMKRVSGTGGLPGIPIGPAGLDVLLSSVEILSLDIFDTILARRCTSPSDVFHWMERKYAVAGFGELRQKAESNARRKYSHRGLEVSLEEIHTELSQLYADTGHNTAIPEDFLEKELDAEKMFLFANPTISYLIDHARHIGIRVIAISDIYLSSKQAEDLLSAAGVCVDEIYTSSDFRDRNLGKYNQTLFSYVTETEKILPEKILHVGDNVVSDIRNAAAQGLCTLQIDQLHKVASFRDADINALYEFRENRAGSLVLGQATQWLGCSAEQPSPIQSFGYVYAGPLLLGFALFILERARSQGIRRLLLLERDGLIIKAVLDVLGVSDIEYRTVAASRRMTVFPNACTGGFEAIASLFVSLGKMTDQAFFDFLMLDTPAAISTDRSLRRQPEQIFREHEDYLRKCAKLESELLLQDLSAERSMLARDEKLAWVDVGWALSSAHGLNTILEHQVKCFCVGSTHKVKPVAHEGYLFQNGQDAHICSAVLSGTELIELIFSSRTPGTARYESTPDGLQRVPFSSSVQQSIRDAFVEEVWNGALEFVHDISDLIDGIDREELRQFNRNAFAKLCAKPNAQQYAVLSEIPHAPSAMHGHWNRIADFWRPGRYRFPGAKRSQHMMSELDDGLQSVWQRSLRLLQEFVLFHLLRGVSRLSPPLPEEVAERFARSAQKRNPRR